MKVTDTTVRRITVLSVVLLVAIGGLGVGQVAAHNPAGIQTAGDDGPHYSDVNGDKPGGEASDTAAKHNPTRNNPTEDNLESGASLHPEHSNSMHNRIYNGDADHVGNAEDPHATND